MQHALCTVQALQSSYVGLGAHMFLHAPWLNAARNTNPVQDSAKVQTMLVSHSHLQCALVSLPCST